MHKLVISILLAAASVPAFARSAERFAENRTYVHHLFATQAECDEAKKKFPFFNCSQWVNFTKEGRATLIVTDIVNPGTYEIKDDTVVITMHGAGETPRVVTFTFDPDESTLRLEPDGTKWVWEKKH